MYELTAKSPKMLDNVVAKQIAILEKEIQDLKSEANRLSNEIGLKDVSAGRKFSRDDLNER